MSRPDFPDHPDILLNYGEPFTRYGKHCTRMNASFFAELFRQNAPLAFYDDIGFVRWEEEKGWTTLDEMSLLNELEGLISSVARDLDFQDKTRVLESDLLEIVRVLKRRTRKAGFPTPSPDAIPAANVLLIWDEAQRDICIREYSPDFMICDRLPVKYDPAATAPQFEAVIHEILPDPEDLRVAQEYLGAALFFVNLTRKFILCYGEGGCGKSVLILFLTKILGAARVFDLNIESVKHDYALAGLKPQTTLLTASEATSGVLCSVGAEWVKKAVGGDFFQTQRKYCNEKCDHQGTFSFAIISNHRLRFQFEGRGDEWRDRAIPIFFDRHIPEERRELGLVDRLLREEGPGILNWFLEGTRRVRQNNWLISISPVQRDRIERLLALSNPMAVFVQNHVAFSAGHSFTSAEAWSHYLKVRQEAGLPVLESAAFYKQLAKSMGEIYQTATVNSLPGKQRGYRGFELV